MPEFNFYSFHVNMNLSEDRNRVVHDELAQHMSTKIKELENIIKGKDHDLLSFTGLQEIYDIRDT